MTMIAFAFLQARRLKQAKGEKRIAGPTPQPSLPAIRQAILIALAQPPPTQCLYCRKPSILTICQSSATRRCMPLNNWLKSRTIRLSALGGNNVLARICSLLILIPSAMSAQAQQLPFREAVRAGDLLMLSGQIGIDPATGTLVAGGIEGEARQTMQNIGTVLAMHGLGYADIVHCRVFIDDIEQWQAFNDVYVTFFDPGRFPARSALGADGLALGAAVEVECTARYRDEIRRIEADAGAPYSEAVIHRGLIRISGIVPIDSETGKFVGTDFDHQLAQVFANLDAVLERAGASRADMLSATVFLASAADKPRMDAAWDRYFEESGKPARTTVRGADWGNPQLLIEIDAVASLPPRTQK